MSLIVFNPVIQLFDESDGSCFFAFEFRFDPSSLVRRVVPSVG